MNQVWFVSKRLAREQSGAGTRAHSKAGSAPRNESANLFGNWRHSSPKTHFARSALECGASPHRFVHVPVAQ